MTISDADTAQRARLACKLLARLGRTDIVVGSSVRILGTGLYAGEVAVVERLTGGVIPAATVRTSAGRTRQVRTIDLEPVSGLGTDVVLD